TQPTQGSSANDTAVESVTDDDSRTFENLYAGIDISLAEIELPPERQAAELTLEHIRLAEELRKNLAADEDTMVFMGNFFRRLGNSTEAMKLWQEALKVNPGRFDIYNNMGRVTFEKGQFEDAIQIWQRALKMEPKAKGVRLGIAQALIAIGRKDEAVEYLREELQNWPDSSLTHFLLGQGYLQRKEYAKAKEHYLKRIEYDPEHPNAYYGLFIACSKLKQSEEAEKYMNIFKKLKSDSKYVQKHRDGRIDDLGATKNDVSNTYAEAARIYAERKDLAKAEECLKRAVQLSPADVNFLKRLASFYQMNSRLPEALNVCQRISQVEPKDIESRLLSAFLSHQLGQFQPAEKALKEIISILPDDSRGYRELALLYLTTDRNPEQAKSLAEKSVQLEKSGENYFMLAWACDVNGDKTGAVGAIENAVKLDPENANYKRAYERITQRK
ncbi:MAG: tetratricopeptide repeat protein, partial [Phycisphaerales bacterium]